MLKPHFKIHFGIKGLLFGLGMFAAAACLAAPVCTPFRAYRQMPLPPTPEIQAPMHLTEGWEQQLLQSISEVPRESEFAFLYRDFLKKNPLPETERYQWLACVNYYIHLPATQGVQWTAIVDQRPSRVIYPSDIDQSTGVARANPNAKIPDYLKFAPERKLAVALQEKLYKDYGILAIDHTDQHAPVVLQELDFLLKNGVGQALVQQLPSLHYLYAFAGHDKQAEVAAYHHQVKAISVGGVASYPESAVNGRDRMALLSALAHEIGHAFVFDHVSATELKQIAQQFGHWPVQSLLPPSLALAEPLSLYSSLFFQALPKAAPKELNTQYAAKNIHEWFAEAFAGKILMDLGHAGLLGKTWRQDLTTRSGNDSYWTNYNNASPEFRDWLNKKIEGILHAKSSKNPHLPISHRNIPVDKKS